MVGKWLREFHRITATEERGRIDLDTYLKKIEMLLSKYYTIGFSRKLGREILSNIKTMKENLSKLPAGASTEDYMKGILADPNGEEFLARNLKAIYPQWAKAFGMSEKNIAFKEILKGK